MTDRVITIGERGNYIVTENGDTPADSGNEIPTTEYVDEKATAAAGDVKQYITGKITDISTAGSTFVACPVAGTITGIWSTINNAITVADAGLSFELAGTAITDGGITVAYDGSAAGDVDSATPTAENTVTAGQAIEMITDGASTTACECTITFEITPA